jgi:thiamine pyrophosphate-dependent acetolactate synthase large subunit-like protein
MLGRAAFVEFINPDFVKQAESYGAKGYRIEAADEQSLLFRSPVVRSGQ